MSVLVGGEGRGPFFFSRESAISKNTKIMAKIDDSLCTSFMSITMH